MPDLDTFFRTYADAFNHALEDASDLAAVRAAFSDCFIGAGVDGVRCGRNDDGFTEALQQGYAFYRSIGTRRMTVRAVAVTPIDELHHLAKVAYTADYQRQDGSPVSIEFEVAYLTRTVEGATRIFAFITGDETALYREHGLV